MDIWQKDVIELGAITGEEIIKGTKALVEAAQELFFWVSLPGRIGTMPEESFYQYRDRSPKRFFRTWYYCQWDSYRSEKILVCLLHNIKKIHVQIMAKGGELGDLTGELQVAIIPFREAASSVQMEGEGRSKNWGYQLTWW